MTAEISSTSETGNDADRLWLPGSARYRLEVLSRGSRVYSPKDYQIKALARRGLVEPLTNQADDAPRQWTITEIGRAMLRSHAELQMALSFSAGRARR